MGIIDPDPGAVITPDPVPQDPAAEGTPQGEPQTPGEQGGSGAPPSTEQTQVPLAALQEERQQRQALQAQLEALKSAVGSQVQYDSFGNPVVAPPPQQQPQNDLRRQLDELWETDPRKAMQTEQMLSIQWYDKINAQVRQNEAELIKKYPDATRFLGDIRKYIDELPLQKRGDPKAQELAYWAVKGKNVDIILSEKEREIIAKIRKGEAVAGIPAGTASTPPPAPGVKATPEQAKVAAAMGMTVEDYLKHVK